MVLLAAFLASLLVAAVPADAQQTKRILLYTGTTGYRHADAIRDGAPVVKSAMEAAGYSVDWEDCDQNGGGANNCDNPNKNPRVFTDANLGKYDAILLFNVSAMNGASQPGPLWSQAQKDAIIRFVQQGGGIAANHNSTDMGNRVQTWDWWDGGPNSAVGALMKGHAATDPNHRAEVQVADRNHLSTRELPETYLFGDEHYNFDRSVRGTHHVLATLNEKTPGYNPGNPMGYDHPISWCKLYDGAAVNDGTGTPKEYTDGRVWLTAMGHFGSSYTANGGNNELVKHIVGGVRWAAGEGKKSDCSGTVWSSFKRTVLVPDAKGPMGIDIAPDGKVYWTEIGTDSSYPDFTSQGTIMMHNPAGAASNKTVVHTLETRADHGLSEDGVLGMTLENGFDLSDPSKRDIYVYYSPRGPWPTDNNVATQTVGYNQVSRFTLNAAGTAVVDGSERVILRVPKVKITGSPAGFQGGPTNNGPGHVGGAGLDFDSQGNLYLGVGDDVSPNAGGHDALVPLDYRAQERWDARKTSANSNDLRGKILRIKPVDGDIPAGAQPGAGTTYTIPAGNMFTPGTPNTRPEIYAMGFRQPFTVQADPAKPGTVVVGEYCHDSRLNTAGRAPAGVCEWNVVDKPAFHGWPFCMGDNSAANSAFRWDYANRTSQGLGRYDCSQNQIPSDLTWAPAGQTNPGPTHPGLAQIPGPAQPATVWKKEVEAGTNTDGMPDPLDFGNLSAGGRSPVTGPVYRYDADNAKPGAFPAYYDGAWLIANRGSDTGFWKEVRLKNNGALLEVNDWAQAGAFGDPNTQAVIPSRFGPDGALYLATWTRGCCREEVSDPEKLHKIMKIEFAVADRCDEDTEAPIANHAVTGRAQPGAEDTFLQSATLTLTAGDAGCAGVKSIEYRLGATGAWQTYANPIEFAEPGDYAVEYRATDRKNNVSAVKTATFKVVEVNDQAAPTVTGAVSGERDEAGNYLSPARVTITATDAVSPIASIEYRVNQVGAWNTTPYTGDELSRQLTQQFVQSGFYYVELRATDKAGNTSEPQGLTFSVVSPCTPATDEFDGSALDKRWLRHTRNGGTPLTGPLAPTLAGGQLLMKTHNFELDGSNGTSGLGPVNFLGQDLNALGDNWTAETQFTVTHKGGWQHVGLIVWQGDNNFFRSTITHSQSAGNIFVEQSKDNPTSAEGSRVQSSGNTVILPSKQPVTIRMRYARAAGSNTLTGQYRIIAPASAATPGDTWVDFPTGNTWNTSGGLQLNPASGPRRDAPGSRIGIIAAGNFHTNPPSYDPADVAVDYFRITPERTSTCPKNDVLPPDVEALLVPDKPGPGGTYNVPVTVNIGAEDADSDVEAIEYAVDGGDWQDEAGAQASVRITRQGDHTVRYRAVDSEGNRSLPKEVSFSIANVRDVFANGTLWEPNELSVGFAESVTWHFDPPNAGTQPHDVWLVPPGETPASSQRFQITNGPQPQGAAPVSYTFRKQGKWTFWCTIHASYDAAQSKWNGDMWGTVDVGADPNPGTQPGGNNPPPGGNNPPPIGGGDPLPKPTATAASFGKLPKTTLARFLKRGVRITSACESGLSGKVTLKLSRKQARKAGLKKKAITLASKSVQCGSNDSVAVTLKASKRVKKALKKARGSLTASLSITMGSGSSATSDTARLVLKAPKRK